LLAALVSREAPPAAPLGALLLENRLPREAPPAARRTLRRSDLNRVPREAPPVAVRTVRPVGLNSIPPREAPPVEVLGAPLGMKFIPREAPPVDLVGVRVPVGWKVTACASPEFKLRRLAARTIEALAIQQLPMKL
jgi:hypothetical protein